VLQLRATRHRETIPEEFGMSTSSPTTVPITFVAGSPQWQRQARRARQLSWLSLAYMAAEGAIAITAAILAGSVALLGFGLDSAIEGLASLVIIWRFTGSRAPSEQAEQRAQRAIAFTFFLLAPYITGDAINALVTRDEPSTSWLGMGLSVASLIVMPLLGVAKKRIGASIDSHATEGEGSQNLLCAYLAAAVLMGLLANSVFGLWWLDPAVGLLIAALAIREGKEAWKGEDCC
jgi:divalent metal cation (Fe/Co/Zn/Cd) transporter